MFLSPTGLRIYFIVCLSGQRSDSMPAFNFLVSYFLQIIIFYAFLGKIASIFQLIGVI